MDPRHTCSELNLDLSSAPLAVMPVWHMAISGKS